MLASDGDLGERLGVFYASYLAGFVFGPPIAGALTVLADVRLPFIVLGAVVAASSLALRDVVVDAPGSRGAPIEHADRRVLRRLITSRRLIAALLVVVSFRYSVGVFEPLWATYLDDLGANTMVVTISLTVFALPMLVIARWAGRLSDTYGPRLTSVLSAAATVPLMAAYGYVGALPLVMLMAIPHGIGEAIQSPGTQAAVADAAPQRDAAAAQGLAEAAGSGGRGDRGLHGGSAVRRPRCRTGVAHRRRDDDRAAHDEHAARPAATACRPHAPRRRAGRDAALTAARALRQSPAQQVPSCYATSGRNGSASERRRGEERG